MERISSNPHDIRYATPIYPSSFPFHSHLHRYPSINNFLGAPSTGSEIPLALKDTTINFNLNLKLNVYSNAAIRSESADAAAADAATSRRRGRQNLQGLLTQME
ncbi:hypothetical protein ACJ72_05532 [Emergomyces africanus]|uniref:Uncharacterized protein n=1 Tax=Emergomyces africanus TaxID=1955775 RepID=A0A1B7NTR9_9EURO|nr:hypothetical protein ACJ72_05532 [Emergomyces africanus]